MIIILFCTFIDHQLLQERHQQRGILQLHPGGPGTESEGHHLEYQEEKTAQIYFQTKKIYKIIQNYKHY